MLSNQGKFNQVYFSIGLDIEIHLFKVCEGLYTILHLTKWVCDAEFGRANKRFRGNTSFMAG